MLLVLTFEVQSTHSCRVAPLHGRVRCIGLRPDTDTQLRFAFFSRFAARFSSNVLVGFFFDSFFRSIPLLMIRAPDECRD